MEIVVSAAENARTGRFPAWFAHFDITAEVLDGYTGRKVKKAVFVFVTNFNEYYAKIVTFSTNEKSNCVAILRILGAKGNRFDTDTLKGNAVVLDIENNRVKAVYPNLTDAKRSLTAEQQQKATEIASRIIKKIVRE